MSTHKGTFSEINLHSHMNTDTIQCKRYGCISSIVCISQKTIENQKNTNHEKSTQLLYCLDTADTVRQLDK